MSYSGFDLIYVYFLEVNDALFHTLFVFQLLAQQRFKKNSSALPKSFNALKYHLTPSFKVLQKFDITRFDAFGIFQTDGGTFTKSEENFSSLLVDRKFLGLLF